MEGHGNSHGLWSPVCKTCIFHVCHIVAPGDSIRAPGSVSTTALSDNGVASCRPPGPLGPVSFPGWGAQPGRQGLEASSAAPNPAHPPPPPPPTCQVPEHQCPQAWEGPSGGSSAPAPCCCHQKAHWQGLGPCQLGQGWGRLQESGRTSPGPAVSWRPMGCHLGCLLGQETLGPHRLWSEGLPLGGSPGSAGWPGESPGHSASRQDGGWLLRCPEPAMTTLLGNCWPHARWLCHPGGPPRTWTRLDSPRGRGKQQ